MFHRWTASKEDRYNGLWLRKKRTIGSTYSSISRRIENWITRERSILAIKIAVLLIRSVIKEKKLKKRRRKKEKEYGSRISSWTNFNQHFDRDQQTSWKRLRLMSTTSRVLGAQLYFLLMYSMNSFRVPITQHRHIYIYTALVILLYSI